MINTKLLLAICITSISCSQPAAHKVPIVSPSQITQDLMSWLYYERDYMLWSTDYQTLDSEQKQIGKEDFLKQLTSGLYLPLRLVTKDSSLCYQLYKIDKKHQDISETIRNKALVEYQYFKMEGSPLPDFDFVDLNGSEYNRQTTNGKLVMIKCWFITCRPCVAEMPMLNELVKEYENRDDVIFLSLAFDPPNKLREFLKKTKFNYRVVGNKEDYLMKTLNISGYPTHLLVDTKGVVVKVSNNLIEIISRLKNWKY